LLKDDPSFLHSLIYLHGIYHHPGKNKMLNIYDSIKNGNLFRKIEVSKLLFVEYTCLREENKLGFWSSNNYFAFISSGKKIWRTIYNSYEVSESDILFVKKGATITHQFFDSDFCAVLMFIPDEFIKDFLKKNNLLLNRSTKNLANQDTVLRVEQDELLKTYYESVRSYLSLLIDPPGQVLLLKFEELLLSLFSNKKHQAITDYFISLCQNQQYHMNRVMEENFAFNLRLGNYAQLCHMSLSTFKKLFKQYHNTTPARWLKSKKLELAYQKVIGTDLSISQVSFECGFEDTSHFIRVFKARYELTPLQFRQEYFKNVYCET
jgi:AraC-like DNA-binding protein